MRESIDAFAAFVDEHYAPICQGLTVAFCDPAVAQEATQGAFARAYARWGRMRRTERPVAWLYVAAARDAIRRVPSTRSLTPEGDADPLEHAIRALTTRERLALVLHHHARLSDRELARALRCSTSTAAWTRHEAHRRLGVEPDEDDDIPEVELDAP